MMISLIHKGGYQLTINKDENTRFLVTLPKDIKEKLDQIAKELTEQSIGKVYTSDLLNEGAKIIIKKYEKSVD